MNKPIKTTNSRKFSDKFWILFFLILAVLCGAVIFGIQHIPHGEIAVIYQDGKIISQIDLSKVRESYTISLPGNTILVEPGYISMQKADCPDQICVRQGKIHAAGQITCLPNRVQIVLQNAQDLPDAKVG